MSENKRINIADVTHRPFSEKQKEDADRPGSYILSSTLSDIGNDG